MRLDALETGRDAAVSAAEPDDKSLRQRIMGLGLAPGAEAIIMRRAPMGDPPEIRLA